LHDCRDRLDLDDRDLTNRSSRQDGRARIAPDTLWQSPLMDCTPRETDQTSAPRTSRNARLALFSSGILADLSTGVSSTGLCSVIR
jgi:hypothetical protein